MSRSVPLIRSRDYRRRQAGLGRRRQPAPAGSGAPQAVSGSDGAILLRSGARAAALARKLERAGQSSFKQSAGAWGSRWSPRGIYCMCLGLTLAGAAARRAAATAESRKHREPEGDTKERGNASGEG